MALTATKLKQVKARLVAGKIIEMLERKGLLNKVEHLGMREWNGKLVMVNKLVGLNPDEQEELEQEINEQVNLTL